MNSSQMQLNSQRRLQDFHSKLSDNLKDNSIFLKDQSSKYQRSKHKVYHNSHKRQDESIQLSSEMKLFLNETLYNSNNLSLTSTLSQPLDSHQAFCPISAIINSNQSSSVLPSHLAENSLTLSGANQSNGLSFSKSKSLMSSTGSKVSDSINRSEIATILNIEWLKRRSKLEFEEGNLSAALNTLTEAQDELKQPQLMYTNLNNISSVTKIGNKSISKTGGLQISDILLAVKDEFIIYDKSVLDAARVLQHAYHNRYLRKCRACTKLSSYFRGYLTRRNLFFLKQIRSQSIINIQRQFRRHLVRIHALVTRIKQWYKIRRFVYMYHVVLQRYKAARRIQSLVRGNQGRLKSKLQAMKLKMIQKIQRQVRRFLVRNERDQFIKRIHRIYYLAARTIQCFIRIKQAIKRTKRQIFIVLKQEMDRQKHQQRVIDNVIKFEIVKLTTIYLQSSSGKYAYEHTKNLIKASDARFEESLYENKGTNSNQYDKISQHGTTESLPSLEQDKTVFEDHELLCYQAMVAIEHIFSDCMLTGKLTAYELFRVLQLLSIPVQSMSEYHKSSRISVFSAQLEQIIEKIHAKSPNSLPIRETSNETTNLSMNDIKIEINDFLDWFCSVDFDEDQVDIFSEYDAQGHLKLHATPITYTAWYQLALYCLNSLTKTSGMSLHQRTVSFLLRENLTWKISEILLSSYNTMSIAMMEGISINESLKTSIQRIKRPRFQCCRCYATFALFSNYYSHFHHDDVEIQTSSLEDTDNSSTTRALSLDKSINNTISLQQLNNQRKQDKVSVNMKNGFCSVLALKSLYFDHFWLQNQWKKQRMCEYEIICEEYQKQWIKYSNREKMIEFQVIFSQDREIKAFNKHLYKSMIKSIKTDSNSYTNEENDVKTSLSQVFWWKIQNSYKIDGFKISNEVIKCLSQLFLQCLYPFTLNESSLDQYKISPYLFMNFCGILSIPVNYRLIATNELTLAVIEGLLLHEIIPELIKRSQSSIYVNVMSLFQRNEEKRRSRRDLTILFNLVMILCKLMINCIKFYQIELETLFVSLSWFQHVYPRSM